jgi:hypothetical protein
MYGTLSANNGFDNPNASFQLDLHCLAASGLFISSEAVGYPDVCSGSLADIRVARINVR